MKLSHTVSLNASLCCNKNLITQFRYTWRPW